MDETRKVERGGKVYEMRTAGINAGRGAPAGRGAAPGRAAAPVPQPPATRHEPEPEPYEGPEAEPERSHDAVMAGIIARIHDWLAFGIELRRVFGSGRALLEVCEEWGRPIALDDALASRPSPWRPARSCSARRCSWR